MDNSHSYLKWSLLSGAAYFLLVAGTYFLGHKVPFLNIYYDLPSIPYEDKIISFSALGWSMFFVGGYSSTKRGSLRSVRYIVLACAGAVGMLCFINFFGDLRAQYGSVNYFVYWVETGLLAVYTAWLAILYEIAKKT